MKGPLTAGPFAFRLRRMEDRNGLAWLTVLRAPTAGRQRTCAGHREPLGSIQLLLRCLAAPAGVRWAWRQKPASLRCAQPAARLLDEDLRWLRAARHPAPALHLAPDSPPHWPPLPDAPALLLLRGPASSCMADPQLAVVGSRHPTAAGPDASRASIAAAAGRGGARHHQRPGARHRHRRPRGRAAGRRPHHRRAAAPASDTCYPPENQALHERIACARARWCPSSRAARRRARHTSRGATASSAAWRAARWWSKPRLAAAR